ncbi:transposase [Streptomyces zagrosensis]|uniref:Uncharacterized protein n=1 Tax=Streptomyces zagrosensis TaxID=1042984 RepID=A0A7W9V289_9ACTN|nr:transposase [Streptomyces zagrosensis]MBB5938594.1 hypothetical protein [Streptomyces zagrosensis]
MAEDYGFAPENNRWVIGGLETSLTAGFEFTTHPHPQGVDVGFAPPGRTLAEMLDRGEIDALFTSNAPSTYLAGSSNIAPLFTDHEARERDWYRRTGIFPMMHTVVARRELFEANAGLAQRLYWGFVAAKDVAAAWYRNMRRLFQVTTMVPWMYQLFEKNRLLLVHVNTLHLQQVLAEPKGAKKLSTEDRRDLTALFWSNINPYGTFRLDMNKRLDLVPAATVPRPRTPADTAARPVTETR